MRKILLSEYKDSMGVLICLNITEDLKINKVKYISYDDLLTNYREILDKNKKYYIYCNSGIRSKKAVMILEYYGYDVTLVLKQ